APGRARCARRDLLAQGGRHRFETLLTESEIQRCRGTVERIRVGRGRGCKQAVELLLFLARQRLRGAIGQELEQAIIARTSGLRAHELAPLVLGAFDELGATTPSTSRMRARPRRACVLTVPSGIEIACAICSCDRPS